MMIYFISNRPLEVLPTVDCLEESNYIHAWRVCENFWLDSEDERDFFETEINVNGNTCC